jgi:hypothetical protein
MYPPELGVVDEWWCGLRVMISLAVRRSAIVGGILR